MEGHALWPGQRTRSFSRADEQDPVHPMSETCGARNDIPSRPDGGTHGRCKPGNEYSDGPPILLGEFFAVCQENHTRLKLEKCQFMQNTIQYLGFNIGYGCWTPEAFNAKPLMDVKELHEDPRKGLHDVRSFIGACNFYRRHIKNFTYTKAMLTDLIKRSTTWGWDPGEKQAVDELKDKVANAKCLGAPRAQGEIILVTKTSNMGGGRTLFQWQVLEKEEYDSAISQWRTDGLN